jgi:hypothetical protein
MADLEGPEREDLRRRVAAMGEVEVLSLIGQQLQNLRLNS